ncbi:MAG: YceH family protein [Actinomycetota bacterium]|nr:YceH family protein [Actinomycetota bacterium]
MDLSAVEARILGCLIEKEITTPQQYPLSANALLLACNQSSNREPVVDYSEADLTLGLDALRDRRLVRFVLPSHGRSVVRYRHVLDEMLELDRSSLSILAHLLLRGPQTLGELRSRTARLFAFGSTVEIERVLDQLAGRKEPLVERADRRPGQKEDRWAEVLTGRAGGGVAPAVPALDIPPEANGLVGLREIELHRPIGEPSTAPTRAGESWWDELDQLKADVAELRAELEELRSSLGG